MRIIDGSYPIGPQSVRADGYVSYPRPTKDFVYNGFDSLLLDFKMEATPALPSSNGQQIQLMVLSSPRPNARVAAFDRFGGVVDPFTATVGVGDNSMAYMQFVFAKVESIAMSPWRRAPVVRPIYQSALISKSEPLGTSVVVEYRGADSLGGGNPGPWFSSVNFANGRRYLQYRVRLVGNPQTGAVPSIESIVIPVN